MKFRKGGKIEVLSKKEVPSGSWRCGEIISGNGHTYDVKHEWYPGGTGIATTERVPRKNIRPCPPPIRDAIDWVAGDLVEVLDNISWKIGTVVKVSDGGYFLVKLLGTSQELRVHKSYLRVRQSWQHDRWVVVGKEFTICEDGKTSTVASSRVYQKTNSQGPAKVVKVKRRVRGKCLPVENVGDHEPDMVSSRPLKRESFYAKPQVETTGADRKQRAIEKDGRPQRLVADHPSSFQEKDQNWGLAPYFQRSKVDGGAATFLLL